MAERAPVSRPPNPYKASCCQEVNDSLGEKVIHFFARPSPHLANMAKTSFTYLGNSADSPAPPLRPSPATGHAAEILDVEDPYLGYDAEKFPYKPPQWQKTQ
jgi:hypothetical protein